MTAILFVTEVRVWPPFGGEKIHAYNVIKALSRDFPVTVLAPQPADDCPLLAQVAGWHDLSGVATSFFRRVLDSRFVVAPRAAWRDQLEHLLTTVRPQVVWFNYGHWGHYADLAHRYGAQAVMQTHNVQSRLDWQGLNSRPLTRWHLYYAARAPLETLHEQMLFRRFDRVISVSEADRRNHARFVGEGTSLYLPNFIDEACYEVNPLPPREADLLVMTGNFGAFQNQVGADWFIEKVWPLVRAARPAARLLLVGIVSARWRKRMQATPGVAFTAGVATAAAYLRRAKAAIVPLQHGSGTRFKILEALACQAPVVSTRMGAEGIALANGVHARVADTPAEFSKAVLDLLQNEEQGQRLAANGLALLQAEYSATANIPRLQQIIADLSGKPNDRL